jgi:hypothetical protein
MTLTLLRACTMWVSLTRGHASTLLAACHLPATLRSHIHCATRTGHSWPREHTILTSRCVIEKDWKALETGCWRASSSCTILPR